MVRKASFKSLDIELVEQISNRFFNLNYLTLTSRNSVNYVYELINKIYNKSIKKSVLKNYLIKSKIAVLKLNDKNYESLIENIATNKNNNYYLILNNLISFFSYQKQNEFSSVLKLKAL